MGGSVIGKPLKKITKFHDAIDPIGKKARNKLEDALGVTRSNELGDELMGTGRFAPEKPGAAITPAGTPTIDSARMSAEQADLLRRRRGRASTVLTSQSGDTSTVNVGTKTLLGG